MLIGGRIFLKYDVGDRKQPEYFEKTCAFRGITGYAEIPSVQDHLASIYGHAQDSTFVILF